MKSDANSNINIVGFPLEMTTIETRKMGKKLQINLDICIIQQERIKTNTHMIYTFNRMKLYLAREEGNAEYQVVKSLRN